MKINYLVTELAPFTGDDKLSFFNKEFARLLFTKMQTVNIFMPKVKLKKAPATKILLTDFPVYSNNKIELVTVEYLKGVKGPDVYFICNKGYFDRTGLYGDDKGAYPDNAERYIFFAKAVIEVSKALLIQPDLFFSVNWASALVNAYLKTVYKNDGFYYKTRTAFYMEDLSFQGVFPKEKYASSGLPWSEFKSDGIEFFDQMSFVKAGIVYSDILFAENNLLLSKMATPEAGKNLEGVISGQLAKASALNEIKEGEAVPFSISKAVSAFIKQVKLKDGKTK